MFDAMLVPSHMRQASSKEKQMPPQKLSERQDWAVYEVASQALRWHYGLRHYSKVVELLTDASTAATVGCQVCVKHSFSGPTIRDSPAELRTHTKKVLKICKKDLEKFSKKLLLKKEEKMLR